MSPIYLNMRCLAGVCASVMYATLLYAVNGINDMLSAGGNEAMAGEARFNFHVHSLIEVKPSAWILQGSFWHCRRCFVPVYMKT